MDNIDNINPSIIIHTKSKNKEINEQSDDEGQSEKLEKLNCKSSSSNAEKNDSGIPTTAELSTSLSCSSGDIFVLSPSNTDSGLDTVALKIEEKLKSEKNCSLQTDKENSFNENANITLTDITAESTSGKSEQKHPRKGFKSRNYRNRSAFSSSDDDTQPTDKEIATNLKICSSEANVDQNNKDNIRGGESTLVNNETNETGFEGAEAMDPSPCGKEVSDRNVTDMDVSSESHQRREDHVEALADNPTQNNASSSSPEHSDLISGDNHTSESSDMSISDMSASRNIFNRDLFSSNSSDSFYSETDQDMLDSMSDNDHAKDWEDVLNKPKPAYTWNSTYQLMRREHGLSSNGRHSLQNGYCHDLNSAFYSSRHVVERMKFSHPLRKHNGCVNSLNFNRSGNLLCTGSDDTQVIVWDWAQNKVKLNYQSGHIANIFQTKFLENGSNFDIISAGRDGEVRRAVIPPSGGDVITTRLYKHRGPVHRLVLSPQNPTDIISVGEDGFIRHYDLRKNSGTSNVLQVIREDDMRVRLFGISHHPFKPEIVVCGCDRFVRVYDKRQMDSPVYEMCPKHLMATVIPQVTCCVYNSTGSEVLASYFDEHIYLFSNVAYQNGEYLHQYRGHYNNKTIKGVNFFGPNSEYVISGSDCSHIFFWDKNTESILNCMPGDTMGVVNCLEPHPSVPILATSGLDHNIKIWAPNSESYPPDLSKLADRVKRNLRRSDLLIEGTPIESRHFQSLMRQLLGQSHARRARNRSQTQNAPEPPASSSSDEADYPQMSGIHCRTQ